MHDATREIEKLDEDFCRLMMEADGDPRVAPGAELPEPA